MVKVLKDKFGILNWCFKRLKATGILEILYRLRRSFRLELLRLRFLLLDRKIVLPFKSFQRPRFFLDEKDIDFIKNKYMKMSEIKDFELNCNNNFRDAGYRAGFCKAEIIKIWEHNRFQWLIAYAQKYALKKDEYIARKIVYILRGWLKENPFLTGVNWLDSLEVSLRLISWIWIYFLIEDSKAFDSDFEDMFLKSIYYHSIFIENNLSRYSSANNHLIGEGVGLFIGGILFPQLNGAERRLGKGKDILEEEIKRQVYSDGVGKEQAAHYQVFIMDLFLLAVIIAEKNNIIFSKGIYSRLEKMCGFLMYMADKNGNLPSIGDSDDGSSIRLNIFKEAPEAISILNTAGVLFKRADFIKTRDGVDEKTLWLLGYGGYKKFLLLKPNDNPLASRGFSKGGYYIMRHRDLFLSFDCGELGYLSLAAHGHADALSITLNIAGRPVLIDPGTYLYHSGGKWRDYFRSTKAHNTVRIDKADQSEIAGPFLWSYKAKSYLKYWSPDGGYDKVCGYHMGYTRLEDPVLHTREIILDKVNDKIIIKDFLNAKNRHLAELFFHLHPDCSLAKIDDNAFKVSNQDIGICIELDRRLNVNLSKGDEDPILGWYSERFGEKVATSSICAESHFEGNMDFITQISVLHNALSTK